MSLSTETTEKEIRGNNGQGADTVPVPETGAVADVPVLHAVPEPDGGSIPAVAVPRWITLASGRPATVRMVKGDVGTLVPSSSARDRIEGVGLELIMHTYDSSLRRVVGAVIRISQNAGEEAEDDSAEVPASLVQTPQAWAAHTKLNLSAGQARLASEWLGVALTQRAPLRLVISRPTWEGNVLALPDAYNASECTEGRARENWVEIVRVAALSPSQALMIGAAVISPMLQRLRLPAFTVHARGDSTTGKTTTAKLASAIWGPVPDPLHSWSATRVAVQRMLADMAGMPLFLDDTGAVTDLHPDKFLGDVAMLVTSGREKARGTREGGLAISDTWCSVLLSTGEKSMLDAARGGAAARVVELHGPLTPDAKTADRSLALALEAHGWPGRWLAQNWPLPALPVLTADGNVARRLAQPVAACAAGFGELARVVGVEVDVQALGQRVLAELSDDMAERGETAGQRLHSALEQDVAANSVAYPTEAALNALVDKGVRGVFKDGYLYVYTEPAKKMAADNHLDLKAAIKELIGKRLVKEGTVGRGLQTRVRVSKSQVSAYAFRTDDQNRLAESTEPVPN